MTDKRPQSVWTGLYLVAACVVALAASAQGKPPHSQASATLDDRLYEIALSSSTPKVYQERLKRLLKRREHERSRVLKVKQGARAGKGLRARGSGHAARLSSLSVPDPALRRILREHGGEVRRADRAAVSVPANALPQNLDITVSQPDPADENTRLAVAANGGKVQASLPVAFGPEGTTFLGATPRCSRARGSTSWPTHTLPAKGPSRQA